MRGSGARPGTPAPRRSRAVLLALAAMIALALLSLWLFGLPAGPPAAQAPPSAEVPAASLPAGQEPQRFALRVRSVRPHDPESYTQGLVWHRGELYESAGQYGRSSLRRVDPKTGKVLRRVEVPAGYFAEGLERVGDRLIQITWRERVAFVYRLEDFGKTGERPYSGEGWGLCFDGKRLVMSDGTDRLTFRDPETFAETGGVSVRLRGAPVFELNELECAEGAVWANVWQTDQILRIDPATGNVTGVVDAAGLLSAEERSRADVLNGIAWVPETRTFLLTGKLWPKLFEAEFVPAP